MNNSYYNPYGGYGGYGGSYGSSYGGYGNNYAYEADPDKYIHTFGISASWGKRLQWPDDYFQLNLGLEYQRYSLKNWSYFLMSDGTANLASLNVILSRNSTDNPIYTRSGSTFTLSGQFTPPYSAFDGKDYSASMSI